MSTLLTYGLATNPNPLAVGREGQLDIVVSNGGSKTVTCNRITFVLPVGHLAQDLIPAGQQPVITVSPEDKWSAVQASQEGVVYAVSQAEAVDMQPEGGAPHAGSDVSVGVQATTEDGNDVSAEGLLITIKGMYINEAYGTAAIGVIEHSASEGSPLEDRRSTVYAAKYPVTDANEIDPVPVGNFRTSALVNDRWHEGLTHLPRDTQVKLHWDGPADVSYRVSGTGKDQVLDVPAGKTEYDFPIKAVRDSVYRLTATKTVGSSTVTRHLTTAVTVDSPAFSELSSSTLRTSHLKSSEPDAGGSAGIVADNDLHMGPGTVLFGWNEELTIGDKLVLKSALKTQGSATFAGEVHLNGEVHGKRIDDSGIEHLTVKSKLIANSLHTNDGIYGAAGELHVKDKLYIDEGVWGAVDLWGHRKLDPEKARNNQYVAPTDGVVVATYETGAHDSAKIWVHLEDENKETRSINNEGTKDYWNINYPNLSVCVPVKKGTRFGATAKHSGDGGAEVNVDSIHWYAVGAGDIWPG